MKYIAFYLPQYHRIPENDEWWGEGFTEWTNVKKASPLFKGHYQPHVPLDNNYYDLDLGFAQTARYQIELAKKGGLYGFCFYHYWFKDGKKLLEKPVESYLRDKTLDMDYCLCWANEPWTRAWDGKAKHVIMAQEYGDEDEWNCHYDYFEPFFKDGRYIKVDGKPMLVIYRPELIDRLDDMLGLFKERARAAGFPGLYILSQGSVYSNMANRSTQIDAYILYEPGYTQNETSVRYGGLLGGLLKSPQIWMSNVINAVKTRAFGKTGIKNGRLTCTLLNYDAYWKRILDRKYDDAYAVVPGAFVAWDNSPRRGFNNSRIFVGATPEKFGRYMKLLSKKAREEANTEFIFINAWNEWGEGAHLEPDIKYGFGYLNALKQAGE